MMEFFMKNAAVIGTVGFFIGFCWIAFVALRKKNKKRFDDYSKIPMNDEK